MRNIPNWSAFSPAVVSCQANLQRGISTVQAPMAQDVVTGYRVKPRPSLFWMAGYIAEFLPRDGERLIGDILGVRCVGSPQYKTVNQRIFKAVQLAKPFTDRP